MGSAGKPRKNRDFLIRILATNQPRTLPITCPSSATDLQLLFSATSAVIPNLASPFHREGGAPRRPLFVEAGVSPAGCRGVSPRFPPCAQTTGPLNGARPIR